MKSVQQFSYVGCTISSDARIDKEVDNRLAKGSSAFGRLYKRVCNNKNLKIKPRYAISVVLTTQFSMAPRPERFSTSAAFTLSTNIHWSEFITNVEVLEQAEVPSIEAMLLKYKLRWVGYVYRMEDHRLPKVVLYGELSIGHRDRRAPKKRYKDCLKKSLNVCHIVCLQWSDMAADREAWHLRVHKAASQFEENRRDSLKDKRQRRKVQAASTTENPDLIYMCRHCTRTCLSRIGLFGHEPACRRRGQQPSWSSFAKPSQTTNNNKVPCSMFLRKLCCTLYKTFRWTFDS